MTTSVGRRREGIARDCGYRLATPCRRRRQQLGKELRSDGNPDQRPGHRHRHRRVAARRPHGDPRHARDRRQRRDGL